MCFGNTMTAPGAVEGSLLPIAVPAVGVIRRNGRGPRGRIEMGEVHRLQTAQAAFGLQAAGRLMTEVFAPWVQDLSLLVETVEVGRPPGAAPDWQPGAIVRLPFSKRACSEGAVVCSQALMALADTAMVIACSAAWNGFRPMSTIDQTTHFLRPVNFDILADARVVRIGRNTSFGRVMLLHAADKRPVGMVASAYSML
jgi:acyl-coenzyme A thioesterase PaaI-like protein